jgi:hypothetical protein
MIKTESKRRCATAVPINDPDPALCGYHRRKASEETTGSKEPPVKEAEPAAPRTKKRVVRPPPAEIRDSPSDKDQRERLMSKMIDNAGLLGRVSLIATPDELDEVQEQRSHSPGSRMDKIRNLIIDMKLRTLRNELQVERAFVFSPIEAMDEFGSIITEARARIPKKESESVKVEPVMGPPKELAVKKKSKKADPAATTEEPSEMKKKKKSAAAAVQAPPPAVVVEPPKPKRKTRFDFPSVCTFAGCEERAVPMTHYCFARAF